MPQIYINPPPADRCCEICGKHVKDLPDFERSTLVTQEGVKLVKTFRDLYLTDWVSASWECATCIRLSDQDAMEVFQKRLNDTEVDDG